ncbi:MAG: ABC transporter substrate-binding protein, partial [Candidatus Hodarchaeota archaeon]
GVGTSVVIAQPGDYVDFNPHQSNSYYDYLIFMNSFARLARRRGEYNLSHAVPWLAESWTASADYKTWNVQLRQGLKWSDGTEFTADDVIFTYHSILDPACASPNRGTIANIVGNASAITKVNDYEVKFVLPEPYAYTETVLFGLEIIQKAQMEAVPLAEWKTHGTNTGDIPMIGITQYQFDTYDGSTTVEMVKNPYYNQALWGHDPNMVGGGNFLPNGTIETITFKVVKEATAAVAGLAGGIYDVIDSQMGIQAQHNEVNDSDWGKILKGYEWGYQEMGINHFNPIFGMNAHDPREMYPDDYGGPAPLDPISVFIAMVGLAVVQIIRRKRK